MIHHPDSCVVTDVFKIIILENDLILLDNAEVNKTYHLFMKLFMKKVGKTQTQRIINFVGLLLSTVIFNNTISKQ